MPGQRKGLGARRCCSAELPELLGAFVDDADRVRERLDVVDDGWFAPKAALSREGRLRPRHAALPLDGGNHRRLLAAYERPGAFHYLAMQRPARAEGAFAQEPACLRILDSRAHALHRQRVFCPDVNQGFVCANRARRDDQPLQHAMWIALHHAAIHECARVSLVRVANNVFLALGLCPGGFPLAPGGETAAATTSQARARNLLANLFRRHLEEGLLRRRIAPLVHILVNALRIKGAT